jgi:hypothetical protein
MMFSTESFTGTNARRRSKHQYVMMFRASDTGLAKRVELQAQDVETAVKLALADRAKRTVDILEDGDFLCRISREADS